MFEGIEVVQKDGFTYASVDFNGVSYAAAFHVHPNTNSSSVDSVFGTTTDGEFVSSGVDIISYNNTYARLNCLEAKIALHGAKIFDEMC